MNDTHFLRARTRSPHSMRSEARCIRTRRSQLRTTTRCSVFGSLNSHWREDVFNNELMSPALDSPVDPISEAHGRVARRHGLRRWIRVQPIHIPCSGRPRPWWPGGKERSCISGTTFFVARGCSQTGMVVLRLLGGASDPMDKDGPMNRTEVMTRNRSAGGDHCCRVAGFPGCSNNQPPRSRRWSRACAGRRAPMRGRSPGWITSVATMRSCSALDTGEKSGETRHGELTARVPRFDRSSVLRLDGRSAGRDRGPQARRPLLDRQVRTWRSRSHEPGSRESGPGRIGYAADRLPGQPE